MIFLIGDCHVNRNRVMGGDTNPWVNTDWSGDGSKMCELELPRPPKFIRDGYLEFAKDYQWKSEDCILVSLGGMDMKYVIFSWIKVDIEAWLGMYDRWLTKHIDPIPIPGDQKALLFVWKQWEHAHTMTTERVVKYLKTHSLETFLGYYAILSEGIRKVADKHGYRFLEFPVKPADLIGGVHLSRQSQHYFYQAWDDWGWQHKEQK